MLRKTQQCQTKKLTVIGDGKENCANAQPGFSGDGVSSVKPEQKEEVEAILKTDVFIILPTGFGKFGKSACYKCLPLLHKKLYPVK